MSDVTEFIEHYTRLKRERIAFAWNGKHAEGFMDTNQAFRWAVVKECISNSERVPLALLEDLFLADSDWAVQAWGAPGHFAPLGSALLVRGRSAALESFANGFNASFDTFGACHKIQLPANLLPPLMTSVRAMQELATDERQKVRLEMILELRRGMETKKMGTLACHDHGFDFDSGAHHRDRNAYEENWFSLYWPFNDYSRSAGVLALPFWIRHKVKSIFRSKRKE